MEKTIEYTYTGFSHVIEKSDKDGIYKEEIHSHVSRLFSMQTQHEENYQSRGGTDWNCEILIREILLIRENHHNISQDGNMQYNCKK